MVTSNPLRRLRSRTFLAVLLVLLSVTSGVVLYRAYRFHQESAAKVSAEKLKQQVAQTLKKNAEDIKFIENKGQWPADVLYGLESATGAVWIRKDEFLFRSVKRVDEEQPANETPTEAPRPPRFQAHVWKMRLAGMDANFKVRSGESQPTIYNYFIDNDHMTASVRSFKEVTLEGVYPGIDLRFYSGDNRQIEYDFIVAPGADYRQIKADYEGQDSLRVAEDKSLELGLRFGTIKTHLPEAYQIKGGQKLPVEVSFHVNGSRAEFEAKTAIDPTLALVIDPTILWGTYFENNNSPNTFDGYAYASKANDCGEVLVGGQVNQAINASYLPSSTGLDTTYDAGASNAVLYKLNPAGTAVLNFTYFGTFGPFQSTTFTDLDTFPDGRVIAVGRTAGTIPVTAVSGPVGAYQVGKGTDAGSDRTGMIAVFNSALGVLHYATYLGETDPGTSNNENVVRSVVTASNDVYYVGGSIGGTPQVATFVNATSPDITVAGNSEGYVARFSGVNYNTRDWATYVGGDGDDHVFSLAVTPDQTKLVFAGWIDTNNNLSSGLVNAVDSSRDGDEVFVGWLTSAAAVPTTFGLLSYIGGSADGGNNGGPDDQRPVVAADNTNLYVAFSSNTDDIPGETTATSPDGFNIVASRIRLAGSTGTAPTVVTRYIGGNSDDLAGGIILTAAGELLIFGSSEGDGYPTVQSTPASAFFDSSHNLNLDIVLTFLSSDLATMTFSTFIGGAENDYLGDTGTLAGGGHYGYNSVTGVVTLATTSHSQLPANVTPGPSGTSKDFTKDVVSSSADSHLIIKFAAEVNDFGDAPLTYDLDAASAARHGVGDPVVPDFARFGLLVDVDPTVQSSTLADADDLNSTTSPCLPAGDDEDGITFPTLTVCPSGLPSSFSATVNAFKNTSPDSTPAIIYAWIDVDGDGIFENNTTEFQTVSFTNDNSQQAPVLPAWNLTTGSSSATGFYARFRITTATLTDVAGGADDRSRGGTTMGEVEDYFIPVIRRDYGDAPDSYLTLAASGGASHIVRSNLFIGAASPVTDSECGTSLLGTLANVDDTTGDDETFLGSLSIGQTATVVNLTVPVTNTTGSSATLCGWIDFNINGVFASSEGRCVTVPSGGGPTALLSWNPIGAPLTAGASYLRLRLGINGSLTTSTPAGAQGDGEVEDHPVTISNSTAVDLASFNAYQLGDSVFIDWKTGFEADNLGFNVYREVGGRRYPVTPSLIAGSALMVGQGIRLEAGLSYAWRDDAGGDAANAQYWLEEVDLNGRVASHGPFNVTSGESLPMEKRWLLALAPRALSLSDIANRLNPIGVTRALEPSAELAFTEEKAATPSAATRTGAAARSAQTARTLARRIVDLSGQSAFKIEVKRAGWYRIPQAVILAAGLDGSLDPQNFQLYADGKQIPIRVTGEEDGRFDSGDAVEFYGVGLDIPSTDGRVYWLMASRQRGQRLPLSAAGGGGASQPSFSHTVIREDRIVYVSAILNGDADNFFGLPMANSVPSVTQTLSTPNLSTESNGAATLEVAMQGVSPHQHAVKVTLNGVVLGTINFQGQEKGVHSYQVAQSQLVAGDNLVKLEKQSPEADVTLIDSLKLTYQHSWKADSNALLIEAQSGQQVSIAGFTASNVRIIDITNPDSPVELAVEVTGQQSDFSAKASVNGGTGARRLYAFTGDLVRAASSVELNKASAWKRPQNGADFLVISHSTLIAALQPLVELRRQQGWRVTVVDVEDLYDEFAFGSKTPEAISDFILYAASNWKVKPRAVMFVGKGTYDPRFYLGQGDADLVPTQIVATETMESAVDDAFADFDGDGIPELAVGRLPVRTAAEAALLVAKIVSYETSVASNRVALISDISDSFPFDGVNDQLQGVLPPGVQVDKISRGQLGDGQARARVLEALNRANRIVNYVGHGSIQLWRGDLLTVNDSPSLQKPGELSLFVMMTCLNGYFISPLAESLSESLLRSPGGAVATWASSGTTTPEGQRVMNVAAFQLLFGAESLTIGEAARAAKAAVAEPDVRRTWNLLGDPTMRLK